MHNEKLFTLIKAPIVTEKSARVGEELKQFVFKVDLSANKREIKQAVEKLLKVTTSIVKGKRKRNRTGLYKRSNYKKAFITLGKDSEIQLEGIN